MDMEDDDEQLDINEEYPEEAIARSSSNNFLTYLYFHRFLSQQTIVYIQYCLLRIPFLIAYDYLLTEQFTSLIENFFQYLIRSVGSGGSDLSQIVVYLFKSFGFRLLVSLHLVVSIPILGFVLLIILLLCSNRHLISFYSYAVSFVAIYFYYQTNRLTHFHVNLFLLQCFLSLIYIQMLNIRSYVFTYTIQKFLCQSAPFILPIIRYLFPLTQSIFIMNTYCFIWSFVSVFELFISQQEIIFYLIRLRFLSELEGLYGNFSLQILFDYLQERIDFVTLMRIFWLTKILIFPLGLRSIYTQPILARTTNHLDLNTTNHSIESYNETLTKTIYFTVVYYGTETTFTLISLACIISYVVKNIAHRLFHLLCLWTEEVDQIGTVIGVMFFLLIFQSSVTQLDLNRRHVPLLKASSLIVTALFHFLHTILEPELLKVAMQTMTLRMAFSTEDEDRNDETRHRPKFNSNFALKILRSFHHRHVYTCFVVLILVILYITFLWRITALSTWLLAVTAFSLELIVRLVASLVQYALYVLDAHRCLSNSDSFDEYIFRIKAITSCCEFILGVFLLFNGFYIFFFEARSALRACMLAIHAHLNILKNFRRGWEIFQNRKSAWHHVSKLPLATAQQIQDYNDICSICHNALTYGSTCVTPCSHFFHQKCLHKAFNNKQNCALCLRPITFEDTGR